MGEYTPGACHGENEKMHACAGGGTGGPRGPAQFVRALKHSVGWRIDAGESTQRRQNIKTTRRIYAFDSLAFQPQRAARFSLREGGARSGGGGWVCEAGGVAVAAVGMEGVWPGEAGLRGSSGRRAWVEAGDWA
jgi:hypothetical protein